MTKKVNSLVLYSLSCVFISSFAIVSCSHMSKKTQYEKFLSDNPKGSEEIPERREFPLNLDVSPCQNFYQHVCSKAQQGFKLREDRNRHMFAFNDSSERILKEKMNFFDDMAKGHRKLSTRGSQLKPFYRSCMNTEARKKEELKIVGETLKELTKFKTRSNFQNWFMERTIEGKPSLLYFSEGGNIKEPLRKDLFLVASWSLPTLPERSYYENNLVRKDFGVLLASFFNILNLDHPDLRAEWVLNFEEGHMKSYPLPRESRDLRNQDNEVERGILIKNYPNLQLKKLFSRMPAHTKIRMFTPDNFEYLNNYLQTAPLDHLLSLAVYVSLSKVMDEAYPQFFKEKFLFAQKHLGGPEKRPALHERCTQTTMEYFTKEVDAELVDILFPNFREESFVKLLKKVKSSIVEGLTENTWLSEEGKRLAIDKINKARFQVVKPRNESEWNFNPTLDYSGEEYIQNIQKLNIALRKKLLAELNQKRNPNLWHMGPLTVNAYYSAADNKFVMPIGILQYPFYSPDLPDHVNLGSVGAVVGHELGHGIDDQGSKYDAQGRLRKWMGDEDLKNFKSRSQILVEQFNQAGFDGQLTLGENIGDFVGLSFAYRAAFPKEFGSQKAKQDFFIQYGRTWCGVMRPKEIERQIKVGPHSIIYARVNEQVKQHLAFEKAFQCSRKDPMTLPHEKRAHIW